MKTIIKTLETAIRDIEVVSGALDAHMRDEYADDMTGIADRLKAVHRMLTNGGINDAGILVQAST